MILGTAGHIDHGKTALVRALTGVDTDRLEEEKRRGITIDLGFAPLEIDGMTIGIVDVPGHEAFIRTMLAGASGIDLALLVVASDEGIMPQTEEHVEILKILGVDRGIVALTKSDLVDDEWLTLQREEVTTFIARALQKNWPVIAVSTKTGSGVDDLRIAIADEARAIAPRSGSDDLFRMPIDRAFSVKGTGTVVTGTIWSGSVARDSTVVVQPGGKTARVRGIEHHGVASNTASAGQRSAIALAGLTLDDVQRGCTLVFDAAWEPTKEISVMIELNRSDIRISSRTRVLFHLGTAEVEGRFAGESATKDGEQRRIARIRLADPIVARTGDRFVLRMPSPARTIGGGIVLDPYPPEHSRRDKRLRTQNRDRDITPGVASVLTSADLSGEDVHILSIRTSLAPSDVAAELDRVNAIAIGSRRYAESVGEALMQRIENIISERVANHSLEAGVSLQSTRAAAGAPADLVGWAVEKLVAAGRIEMFESLVRPRDWQPELREVDQSLSNSIMHEICKEPSEPPSVDELEGRFGGKARPLLRKLEREGKLKRVSDDRYYSSEAVDRIIDTLRRTLEPGRIYSPAELREVLGVSRKYLIPFLEFCDRLGVTERRKEGRAVRPNGPAVQVIS